jgi:hypothetical protein
VQKLVIYGIDFAGFTYTGNVFNQERFTNLWLTFPKPVPTDEPIVTFIANDESFFTSLFNEVLGIYVYIPIYFPTNFDTAYANNNTGQNEIHIEQDGAYRLTCNGTLFFPTSQTGIVNWRSVNAINQVISSGSINASLNQSVVITAVAGGRIILGDAFPYFADFTGSIESTLEFVEGFTASFDEALIDLNIKDFVNEIMQHFGLTAFKDPFTNNIDYLMLDEILQNTNVIDWSDKFTGKSKESYILNNYAQLNKYKYRYNEANQTHNDGSISIANQNIKDEVTVLQSICYTPERQKRTLLGLEMNVYRIWNREIKDDATVEYKDLTGRYYFIRVDNHTFSTTQTIKSEALGIEDTFTIAPIESYNRLPLQQVIFDNYSTIESIFNRARILDTSFYLSAWDVQDFTFKQLIYVRQLAGYFQVNKIPNFIKGKETKVELVEVDYFTEIPVIIPIDYWINVLSISELACEITIEVETNLNVDLGLPIELIPYAYTWSNFGGYVLVPFGDPIPYTLFTSTIVTTITTLPPTFFGGYFFKVRHTTSVFEIIESGLSGEVNLTGCYIPPIADLNYINLVTSTVISIIGNVRTIEIEYESDLSITDMDITLYYSGQTFYVVGQQTYNNQPQNGTLTIEVPNAFLGAEQFFNIYVTALGITSNTIVS